MEFFSILDHRSRLLCRLTEEELEGLKKLKKELGRLKKRDSMPVSPLPVARLVPLGVWQKFKRWW